MTKTITINGKDYALNQLSAAARTQVANIQFADAELARLGQQQALVQTARNAYVSALVAALEEPVAAAPVAAAEAEAKPAAAKKPAARKSTKKSV